MLTPDQIRLRLRDGDDLADTCGGCTVVLDVLREVLPLLVAAATPKANQPRGSVWCSSCQVAIREDERHYGTRSHLIRMGAVEI
jgi:hypothetical protein